jgi:hypothetical protein
MLPTHHHGIIRKSLKILCVPLLTPYKWQVLGLNEKLIWGQTHRGIFNIAVFI